MYRDGRGKQIDCSSKASQTFYTPHSCLAFSKDGSDFEDLLPSVCTTCALFIMPSIFQT